MLRVAWWHLKNPDAHSGTRCRLAAARLAGEPATTCLTSLIKGGCAPLSRSAYPKTCARLPACLARRTRPRFPLAAARCQSSVLLDKAIASVLGMVDIRVLDHIIVAGTRTHTFAERPDPTRPAVEAAG